jgi:hypothetical protein
LSDIRVSVTQRITQSWDVVGRGAREWLEYRGLLSSTGAARTDRGLEYGGGLGYRLGRSLRFGAEASRIERRSVVTGADYQGTRIGGSVSYAVAR